MLTKELIEQIASAEVQEFIFSHQDEEVSRLLLKRKEVSGIPIREIAVQISARQKAKDKLREWYKTKGLVYPESISMEQSSSELTALYKSALIEPDFRLTDLTGGLGVDSYYFSRVAQTVTYVEKQQQLCWLAEHNFPLLKAANITIINKNLEDYLKQWRQTPTEYVYIDPGRRDEKQKKVFLLEDCEPNLNVVLHELLPHTQLVIVKLSPLFDIHLLMKLWSSHIQAIHVLSVKNDCKELLVIFGKKNKETSIHCANLGTSHPLFVCDYPELNVPAHITGPGKYLYEPNASVMKAGAYDVLAVKEGLNKLHRYSQLYTADNLLTSYPGRTFLIKEVLPVDKKIAGLALPGKKANITVRNFPLSPDELSKKLGFKTGGDDYFFATTLSNNAKAIIWCKKVI